MKNKAKLYLSFTCTLISTIINILMFANDYHKYKTGKI